MTTTISKIEAKGYIVKARENTWMGKLDAECPTVYEILRSDYSTVYGANGIGPDELDKWLDTLSDLTAEKPIVASDTAYDPCKEAQRKTKEREWDAIYNEGGEGYNPYR